MTHKGGRPRKNPADMAYGTLVILFKGDMPSGKNWTFPLDTTSYLRTKAQRMHMIPDDISFCTHGKPLGYDDCFSEDL